MLRAPRMRREPTNRRSFVMLPHFVSARARTTRTQGQAFLADYTQMVHHRDSGAILAGTARK